MRFANLKKSSVARKEQDMEDEYTAQTMVSIPNLDRAISQQASSKNKLFFNGLRRALSLKLLDAKKLQESKILVVGAGSCVLAQALDLAGADEVYAIDAVPMQIWAAAMDRNDSPNMRFVIADLKDLPFEKHSFDIVVADLVLHHVPPLSAALGELFRALRRGSSLVIMEPSLYTTASNLSPIVKFILPNRFSKNERFISLEAMKRTLTETGFVDIESQRWFERYQTSLLGRISPSYLCWAKVPGEKGAKREIRLRRDLNRTHIRGLLIDSGCTFADLAQSQIEAIVRQAAFQKEDSTVIL